MSFKAIVDAALKQKKTEDEERKKTPRNCIHCDHFYDSDIGICSAFDKQVPPSFFKTINDCREYIEEIPF